MTEFDLNRFRKRLIALQARYNKELKGIIEELPDKANGSGDLSNLPTHNADRDSEGLDKDMALLENEQQLLMDVDEALRRLNEGTFGVCTQCGAEIEPKRLDALPFTPVCITCAQKKDGRRPAVHMN